MATVIGLYSGKELVVQDEGYIVGEYENAVRVMFDLDGKRRYTIPMKNIEYYNEPNTEKGTEFLKALVEAKEIEQKEPEETINYG